MKKQRIYRLVEEALKTPGNEDFIAAIVREEKEMGHGWVSAKLSDILANHNVGQFHKKHATGFKDYLEGLKGTVRDCGGECGVVNMETDDCLIEISVKLL